MVGPSTFFSTLSLDAAGKILRWCGLKKFYACDDSDLVFTPQTMEILVGVMPKVVIQEVSEVTTKETFDVCYCGKPVLISSLSTIVTSSLYNAFDISEHGSPLKSLWIHERRSRRNRAELVSQMENVLELILTTRGAQLPRLVVPVESEKAAILVGEYCRNIRRVVLRTIKTSKDILRSCCPMWGILCVS